MRAGFVGCLGVVALSLGCRNKPDSESGPGTDTETDTETGPTGAHDPIALGLIGGDGLVIGWVDRALVDGEVIERDPGTGAWEAVSADDGVWRDTPGGVAYRVVSGGDVLAEAVAAPLTVAGASDGILLRPTDAATATFTVALDGLPAGRPALPVEVVLGVVDGASSLDADCAGAPCWDPSGASVWSEEADLPSSVVALVPAFGAGPGVVGLQLRLRDVETGLTLAAAEVSVPEVGLALAWGDLHSHTGLSHDGCEDPADRDCPARTEIPGAEEFANGVANGLDFVALTDHAEWDRYQNAETGVDVDIWDQGAAWVAEAEGSGIVPMIGYEWTSAYTDGGPVEVGGHRTVVFEDPAPCRSYRVPAVPLSVRKPASAVETYTVTTSPFSDLPSELAAALAAAGSSGGCTPTRYVSYFHHPAYDPPAWVDWTSPLNEEIDNPLVEIYSEHGSSECASLDIEGCDWNINDRSISGEAYWRPDGSVQRALQLGYAMGFVGGTDNHEASPGYGLISGVPGHTATIFGAELAFSPGAVTGVLHDPLGLDRAGIMDALLGRRTFASSWLFEDLRVAAVGADGALYLPGSDVPEAASPLTLLVVVGDAATTVRVQLIDADGASWVDEESASVREPFDLLAGDVRYVRVRAWFGDVEHRAWASPFFGTK